MHGTAYSEHDLRLLAELKQAEAREDYWAFRKYLDPRLLAGWWQQQTAIALNQFYQDMLANKRPKLVIAAPPQHGKTRQTVEFATYIAGLQPGWKTIYTSYADDLGHAANAHLQRSLDGQQFPQVFPTVKLPSYADRAVSRNSYLVDYVDPHGKPHGGSFRNTTVGGQINGLGLDLGIIDDPIKGRAEANSELIREKTWNWLTDDFFGRFSDHAGMIFIMTSWHIDDPMQRFLVRFPGTKILRFPALADATDSWKQFRRRGEPLFPEFKSREFLAERKAALSIGSWEAQYQQNPIVIGGGMFPIERFKITTLDKSKVTGSARYWDKAGTEDGGAWTAGVRMHKLSTGQYVISDVRRGQWEAIKREQHVKQCAQLDGYDVQVYFEQEPGSGGKESAENSVRMLAGWRAYADKVTGDKVTRAEPYAAQVQNGNVLLCEGDWVSRFLEEHEAYPNGKYLDQVDAAAGAFNKLSAGTYDTTLAWVG